MTRDDLEGKIAVVTGAARRTGLTVVEHLLASGATVSIRHGDGHQRRHVGAEHAGETEAVLQ